MEKKTYGLVGGINKDDLEIFVDSILVDPVRVKNPQITASSPNTLFRDGPKATLGLDVVDTLANRLAVGST